MEKSNTCPRRLVSSKYLLGIYHGLIHTRDVICVNSLRILWKTLSRVTPMSIFNILRCLKHISCVYHFSYTVFAWHSYKDLREWFVSVQNMSLAAFLTCQVLKSLNNISFLVLKRPVFSKHCLEGIECCNWWLIFKNFIVLVSSNLCLKRKFQYANYEYNSNKIQVDAND